MEMVQVIQKINLVDNCYSPTEAKDLISDLVEKKLEFLKIQNLKEFIHDSTCDCRPGSERIEELKQELADMKKILDQSRVDGKGVRVNCVLEISYDD